MTKKEKQDFHRKSNAPDTALEPDSRSLKNDPAGETVCSPYFSQGCINEDTDLPAISEDEAKRTVQAAQKPPTSNQTT